MINFILFQFFLIVLPVITGCNTAAPPPSSSQEDPTRCIAVDVGEASDFILQKKIIDNRTVIMHGLTNPQSLVWRDDGTGKTFFLARIMGSERRLYFLKEVPDEEPPPGVLSRFEGHLLRWSNLPQKQSQHMALGLKSQYNITIEPDNSYIIIHGQKPEGCK